MNKITSDVKAQHLGPYLGRYIDDCPNQAKLGYPKALATLRSWNDRALRSERLALLKGSFDRVFGNAAKRALALVEQVQEERAMIVREIENQEDGLTVDDLADWLYLTGRADSRPHPEALRAKIRAGKIAASKEPSKRGQGGQWVVSLEEARTVKIGKVGRPKKEAP